MAKAISSNGPFIFGNSGLGHHGDGVGSIKQNVHDGDTINVRLLDNLAIRFLGIDTPEISFNLPEKVGEVDRLNFVALGNPAWEDFLSDPFAADWKPFSPALDPALENHLAAASGPGSALNQHALARAAEDVLEEALEADVRIRELAREDVRLFMAFATDVMDGFGRLLCYLNIQEADASLRPETYNERLLVAGQAVPYFIWPNVDPFRRESSVVAAALSPLAFRQRVAESPSLIRARAAVAQARNNGLGIFNNVNPLRLLPFELRFLARRSPPSRWVINLAAEDDALLPPQRYIEIPKVEDRLFIPEEYVPLFMSKGWRTATCGQAWAESLQPTVTPAEDSVVISAERPVPA